MSQVHLFTFLSPFLFVYFSCQPLKSSYFYLHVDGTDLFIPFPYLSPLSLSVGTSYGFLFLLLICHIGSLPLFFIVFLTRIQLSKDLVVLLDDKYSCVRVPLRDLAQTPSFT